MGENNMSMCVYLDCSDNLRINLHILLTILYTYLTVFNTVNTQDRIVKTS